MQASLAQHAADRDPGGSGRTSRASNFSVASKSGLQNHQTTMTPQTFCGPISRVAVPLKTPDGMAPGVMDMLRTTMEIGDVGSLVGPPTGRSYTAGMFHPSPRYNLRLPGRKGGTVSRQSGGSGSSHQGGRSRHHVWPSVSSTGRQRSITSNVTAPPCLEPGQGQQSLAGYSHAMPRSDSPPGATDMPGYASGRSLSMTMQTSSHGPGLSNHRSVSSLRSAPREGFSRPTSPFHYPTRLRRPRYRPSSPALGDLSVALRSRGTISYGKSKMVHAGSIRHHHAPFPAHRNRSSSAVAAVSRSTGGSQLYFGDDSPYSTDQSARKATQGNRNAAANRAIPRRYHYDTTSSDPTSSSSPPTPKDSNYNEPVVIEQGLTTRKHVGHVAPHPACYDYTGGYDFQKEVTELFNETLPDLPMPSGFVDRIRSILDGDLKARGMGLSTASGLLQRRRLIQTFTSLILRSHHRHLWSHTLRER